MYYQQSSSSTGVVWATIIAVFLFFAVVGALIGKSKGRGVGGFFLGLFLGFIGVIIVAVLPPTEERQRQRDRQLAYAIAEANRRGPRYGPVNTSGSASRSQTPAATAATGSAASGAAGSSGSAGAAGSSGAAGPAAVSRKEAVAEAIRRDPTLTGQDPETLARLVAATEAIEKEMQVQRDLQAILAEQQAERDADAKSELKASGIDPKSKPPNDMKAGWRRDPFSDDPAARRMWDGTRWTDETYMGLG